MVIECYKRKWNIAVNLIDRHLSQTWIVISIADTLYRLLLIFFYRILFKTPATLLTTVNTSSQRQRQPFEFLPRDVHRARYCYGKSSVRPSDRSSVTLMDCDHIVGLFEYNFRLVSLGMFALCRPQYHGYTPKRTPSKFCLE